VQFLSTKTRIKTQDKFKESNVQFTCTRIQMRIQDKFKDY